MKIVLTKYDSRELILEFTPKERASARPDLGTICIEGKMAKDFVEDRELIIGRSYNLAILQELNRGKE